MSLNRFKAAIRTIEVQPDYLLIAQSVDFLRAVGFNPSELYRAALAVDPSLTRDRWEDVVKTAFERHPQFDQHGCHGATHDAAQEK